MQFLSPPPLWHLGREEAVFGLCRGKECRDVVSGCAGSFSPCLHAVAPDALCRFQTTAAAVYLAFLRIPALRGPWSELIFREPPSRPPAAHHLPTLRPSLGFSLVSCNFQQLLPGWQSVKCRAAESPAVTRGCWDVGV